MSSSHTDISEDPIVIVGIGGVFPGAKNLDEFWRMIVDGKSAAAEVPAARWAIDPDAAYQEGIHDDHVYSKHACLIDDFTLDSTGIQLDKELIEKLDPMFHLLLSAGRDAWCDSQHEDVDRKRCGIIVGNIALPTEYSSRYTSEILGPLFSQSQDLENVYTNNHKTDGLNRYVTGLPAGVLAQALGLHGGTHTLDAACASSLYALKYAADELRAGRADCMLAGGVSRPDSLYTQMGFSQLHALSTSGTCAPFSSDGDGLVVGEGAGIFILKRLSDAQKHGDHIYSRIAGIGLSNDLEGNLFLPASEGQCRAMADAYTSAGWKPASVDHIECHGTGTPTGDAVEFNSLRTLWANEETNASCVLGSVKSNVGHLLTGAGAAGLMKTLLAFKHQCLPPTAHFVSANDTLDIDNSPFTVLAQPQDWQQPQGHPRRAAMSAFGFGGINAHVLIEEYVEERIVENISENIAENTEAKTEKKTTPVHNSESDEDIALVGLAAHFGQWENLAAVSNRMFNVHENTEATASAHWLQSPRTAQFTGYSIDELHIPIGRFRIPPKELSDLLPQQLLMLLMAADALDDANDASAVRDSGNNSNSDNESDKDSAEKSLRTGVYIGIGLDPQTCNFHLRWSLEEKLRRSWAADIPSTLQDQWLQQLRDACHTPLTANRTMGALGGIVASRIARALHCGGPSFTVSNEECSGMQALETAVRSLRTHDIDRAIIGAVDFASDIRSVLSQDQRRAFNSSDEQTIFGDGACAFVAKRLSDAERDGDRIYACIRGISHSNGADIEHAVPQETAYTQVLEDAYNKKEHAFPRPQLIISHGSNHPKEQELENNALARYFAQHQQDPAVAISSSMPDIGHCGAASGLAAVLKASLSLHHKSIPLSRLSSEENAQSYHAAHSRYWLHNADAGPRVAAASSMSCDGNVMHTVLCETPGSSATSSVSSAIQEFPQALFLFSAANNNELITTIENCLTLQAQHPELSMHQLAGLWTATQLDTECRKDIKGRENINGRKDIKVHRSRCACVIENKKQLLQTSALLISSIHKKADLQLAHAFFIQDPLHTENDVAFVFPGSGNHFTQMGSSMSSYWPQVLEQQSADSQFYKDQFAFGKFWSHHDCENFDHRDGIFGQVWYGAMVSDVMSSFGLKPDAIIGYSLGETAGFFASKTWRDRDGMLQRIHNSELFTSELAGKCQAVRDTWNCTADEIVDWSMQLVDTSVENIRSILDAYPRVYVLIINTPSECVIGGDRQQVSAVIEKLQLKAHAIEGVTTVHCEVAKPVAKAYRDLHLFPCTPPEGVRFYSGIAGASYEVNTDSAADSIIGQALEPFNYAQVIQQAYDDGIRIFIEMGPRGTCSRMIDVTLADQPHACIVASVPNQDGSISCMRSCALAFAHGINLNADAFYKTSKQDETPWKNFIDVSAGKKSYPQVTKPIAPIPLTTNAHSVGSMESNSTKTRAHTSPRTAAEISTPMPPAPTQSHPSSHAHPHPQSQSHAHSVTTATTTSSPNTLLAQMQTSMSAQQACHQQFLRVQQNFNNSIAQAIAWSQGQEITIPQIEPATTSAAMPTPTLPQTYSKPSDVLFDYNDCMEIATGSIAKVLGDDFAIVDSYPTRVRLPDEPLMLAHRIMSIDAVQGSMTNGSIITEHDIHADAWYLDCGRIPTCIAVEAGQADLFLSGYLGIDFITKGQAVYRLLDAEVCFYRELPSAGNTIRYDIRIIEFFKQGSTYLFRFEFDATIKNADGSPGELLLTMRKGIAGFFSQAELDAGKGVVLTAFDLAEDYTQKWLPPAPMSAIESYNESDLQKLRNGDLAGCFGELFANNIGLRQAVTIPDGRMRLVHRIKALTPNGGRFGLGLIVGEADIHPDDWFLTCHFCDDMVMPGTLMYECCLHTLRVYLLRMGWVGEASEISYQPIDGIASILQCRGQVLQSTKMVTYELCIQEIGYRGPEETPYVIADAIMYADGKRVVRMKNMALQISGLSQSKVNALWQNQTESQTQPQTPQADPDLIPQEAIFTDTQIIAYAEGKPSEAFGDRYKIFDHYHDDNDLSARRIARLPRDPFKFINRITHIRDCEQWEMKAGGTIVARYDVPPDAWYFTSNEQSDKIQRMPFAVLLETALQPCGWMAAYVGSALSAEHDLKFRNLGGKATQYIDITPDIGTLSTKIHLSNVSSSGGMVIQNYDMEMWCDQGLVYKGDTVFGFFSSEALATQIGIRDAKIHQPTPEEKDRALSFAYPEHAPFPDAKMRMIETVTHCDTAGGSKGLGFIEGTMDVNPDAWFFQAHFYQDPVIPGSLGLESFQQLLKVIAWQLWGDTTGKNENNHLFNFNFTSMPLEHQHTWLYRGQVVPKDTQVTVKADVTAIDHANKKITAKGYLIVDGRAIYQMIQFAIEMR